MRTRKKAIDFGVRCRPGYHPKVMSTCIQYLELYTCQVNAMAAGLTGWFVRSVFVYINTVGFILLCVESCLRFNVLAKDRKIDNIIKSKVLFPEDYNIVNDVLINIKPYSIGST